MADQKNREFSITPANCLEQLPEIPLDLSEKDSADDFRRAELRHSVLEIADLNHVNETAMIRSAVINALGRLPEFEG